MCVVVVFATDVVVVIVVVADVVADYACMCCSIMHLLHAWKSHGLFALLVPSCWQVWNKLLSSCNKVDEANRLATSCSNKSDIVCT